MQFYYVLVSPLLTHLKHEIGDDPVEYRACVGEPLGVGPACDLQEVPGGARDDFIKQLHRDPTIILSTLSIVHLNIEENSEEERKGLYLL